MFFQWKWRTQKPPSTSLRTGSQSSTECPTLISELHNVVYFRLFGDITNRNARTQRHTLGACNANRQSLCMSKSQCAYSRKQSVNGDVRTTRVNLKEREQRIREKRKGYHMSGCSHMELTIAMCFDWIVITFGASKTRSCSLEALLFDAAVFTFP